MVVISVDPVIQIFIRGKTNGEVKNWNRPMCLYDVREAAKKGRNETVNKSGFIEGAIKFVLWSGLKLFHGDERVV